MGSFTPARAAIVRGAYGMDDHIELGAGHDPDAEERDFIEQFFGQ